MTTREIESRYERGNQDRLLSRLPLPESASERRSNLFLAVVCIGAAALLAFYGLLS